MIKFMLLFSRQGKVRLQKWFNAISDKERKKITRELVSIILARRPKMCNFLDWKDLKIVYKRYASLFFCCAIEDFDNELLTLEIIHRYVEILDKYFGSVCELDIIFNFEKAYYILDEFILAGGSPQRWRIDVSKPQPLYLGEIQESSKKKVLQAVESADAMQEEYQEAEATRSILEDFGLA